MSVTIEEIRQTVAIEEDESVQTIQIVEEVVNIVEIGIQGPQGAPGADGSSGDLTFRQIFNSTDTVNVTHNLGKYPSVTVIDSAEDEVEGEVSYVDINNLIIRFSAPFSGTVTLN